MGKVSRRDFIVKGGKYALFTAASMQVLFTSKRAMAQSGLARFVVDVESHVQGLGVFTGPPSTSPTGTWQGSSYYDSYRRYSIAFSGDTGHLPATVPVTVHWEGGILTIFHWDETGDNTKIRTFSVPKTTGGTIGVDGTILDTVVPVPVAINLQGSPQTGTVTFTAPGVQTLTISVIMPPP